MLKFQNVTMSECGNQHLDSVGLSNWEFCYLLNFFRMCYHRLPDTTIVLPFMLSFVYGNFAPFLAVSNLNKLPEVL